MKEVVRIRVAPNIAQQVSQELGIVGKVAGTPPTEMFDFEMPVSDPRWEGVKTICASHAAPRTAVGRKLLGWAKQIGGKSEVGGGYVVVKHTRVYTTKELEEAEYIAVLPPVRPILSREPDEERKIYDLSGECPSCRYGWKQVGKLTFSERDLRERYPLVIPFGRNEWVVHVSVRDLFEAQNIAGAEFLEVVEAKSKKGIGSWFQLACKKTVAVDVQRTQYGYDPLYRERELARPCPQGHAAGLWRVSEIHIERRGANFDLALTDQFQGGVGSIGVPVQTMIVSRRLFLAMRASLPNAGIQYEVVRSGDVAQA